MEEIPLGILRFLGRFLVRLLVDVLMVYSGEEVLFLATLSRRKPRWDYYANETGGRFVVCTEISFWIGAVFWIAVAVMIQHAMV